MKLVATRKSEQNTAALDPWTIVHLGTGLASGLMGVGFWTTFGGAVAYEILEQAAERHQVGQRLFKSSKHRVAPRRDELEVDVAAVSKSKSKLLERRGERLWIEVGLRTEGQAAIHG